MTAADLAIITGELGPLIKRYVEQVTAPLIAHNKALELRVLELETRPPVIPERGERGEPGQKGDTGVGVASLVVSADQRLIAHYTDGRVQDFGPMPKGIQGDRGEPGESGSAGLNGKDGRDGIDGKDGAPGLNGKDGAPGLDGKDGAPGLNGKDGAPGLNGKDGVGVMDAVQDRAGHLILTMSDGRTKDVGVVAGRDGLDGKDGIGIAGAPGRDGLNGKDGLGFDDWDLSFDPTRGVVLQLRQGERVKDFVCPMPFTMLDWAPGSLIPKGGCVQHDGGWWTALHETTSTPGENHADWQLLVRRGKQGKEGKPGKDFTPRISNTPPLYGY